MDLASGSTRTGVATGVGQLPGPAGELGSLALRAVAGMHLVTAGLARPGLVRGREGADRTHIWCAHDAIVPPRDSDRIGDIPESRP